MGSVFSFITTQQQTTKHTMEQEEIKLPIPPFTLETAKQKIQLAEDGWNSQDPVKVSEAYTIDSEWRNRYQFVNGREEIRHF